MKAGTIAMKGPGNGTGGTRRRIGGIATAIGRPGFSNKGTTTYSLPPWINGRACALLMVTT